MASTSPRSAAGNRKRSAPLTSQPATPVDETAAPEQEPEQASATPPATADASTLDEALAAWSGNAGRVLGTWSLTLCATWLQGARAIREEQRAAAERAEAACLATGRRLQSAIDWQHAAAVQAEFLREQVEESVETAMRLAGIARENALTLVGRAAEGWSEVQRSGMDGMNHWAQVQAALPTSPEVLEAEAEHLTNPIAAGPLMWPAQEAMRQSMTFASSVWNDWMESAQSRIH